MMNFAETIFNQLSPTALNRLSLLLGESKGAVRAVLSIAIPSILSCLSTRVSREDQSAELLAFIRAGDFSNIIKGLDAALSNEATISALLSNGEIGLAKYLGENVAVFEEKLVNNYALKNNSAETLLNIACTLCFAALLEKANAMGLSPQGLSAFLLR